jgi:hypothetical protein
VLVYIIIGSKTINNPFAVMEALFTFLSLVEDWWAGMVEAIFVRIAEHLAARLMDTFLRHDELVAVRRRKEIEC